MVVYYLFKCLFIDDYYHRDRIVNSYSKSYGKGVTRSITCFDNDPHITNNGVNIARDAARTIQIIIDNNKDKNFVIYSSKLLRCIQTSYHIALQNNLPICLRLIK